MPDSSLSGRNSPAIAAWFDARMQHKDLPTLTSLCEVLESADPRMRCEIKWNTPSYLISDHFATTGIMPKGGVRLVLHSGATRREVSVRLRDAIEDPSGTLDWKDEDRAILVFHSSEEVDAAQHALTPILRQWIELTQ